jgi:putative thioredoxin
VRAFFEKLLPSHAELALAEAEALFRQGKLDEAEAKLKEVKFDPDWEARMDAVTEGIALARRSAEGPGESALKEKLARDPADHEARAALAAVYAARKRYREAMDELLEILKRAKDWKDGEARKQLLALFNLAEDPELASEYRKKLAREIY